MRSARGVVAVLTLVGVFTAAIPAAADYPLTLVLHASLQTETTTVSSSVLIRVDRLTEESRRKRVIDALRYSGGYPTFLQTLRALPQVGAIELARRKVEIRYAHEDHSENGRRLVLVADRPLFFLSGNAEKPRAGYELTIVELQLEDGGRAAGTMAGAARVKPRGDDIVVDDYAESLVQLTVR